jgi:phage terminase large subunit GpA-like protein
LELEIVGWCRDKVSYSIDYRVLVGDTAAQPVWNLLADVVNEHWEREDGAMIPCATMAVDTGYNTQHVYDFVSRFDGIRVIPVKGQDALNVVFSPPRQVNTTRGGKKIGKTKVYHVGSSLIKSELYGWLRVELEEDGSVPRGYCHFPQYDQHYFKMLTAEQIQYKIIRGYRVPEWVKKYERNEALDCRVYARAAASVVGIDRLTNDQLERMSASYERRKDGSSAAQRKEKRPRGSSFW